MLGVAIVAMIGLLIAKKLPNQPIKPAESLLKPNENELHL
jgi:hypothetical protein